MRVSHALTKLVLVGTAILGPDVTRSAGEDAQPPPTAGPAGDQDPAMLERPAGLADDGSFVVAKTPPRITFSGVTGLPVLTKDTGGLWCSWGEGLVASTGKMYVGIGDHRGIDGRCFVYEYDPDTHRHRQVLATAELVGQKPGQWGHGKLHGRLDEMPDGWIYMATYWGEHPDRYDGKTTPFIGGGLFRYNARTQQGEYLGMPLPGDSFPMHATDTARGIFHAIGLWENYLAYDLHARRALYAGPLPGDITWHFRATLVDPKTGCCYGSEVDTRRMVKYDPHENRFSHTRALVPEHPKRGQDAKHWIRSYTRQRLPDGSFFVQTYDGVMFKFWPDQERTEYLGLNWGDGLYSTSVALSPGGRYVYFAVGAHGQTWESGSPVIQYDVQERITKVLAFLHPFYQRKYGYVFGGSYSVLLDKKGQQLFITWNGRFRAADQQGESFGHPSFMCLEIPESERAETLIHP